MKYLIPLAIAVILAVNHFHPSLAGKIHQLQAQKFGAGTVTYTGTAYLGIVMNTPSGAMEPGTYALAPDGQPNYLVYEPTNPPLYERWVPLTFNLVGLTQVTVLGKAGYTVYKSALNVKSYYITTEQEYWGIATNKTTPPTTK